MHMVYCNVANPQSFGQQPTIFFREVFALCEHLTILDKSETQRLFRYQTEMIQMMFLLLISLRKMEFCPVPLYPPYSASIAPFMVALWYVCTTYNTLFKLFK
ncbi:hypothetical protein PanWU01x14_177790 [Parasponia andersonii]|uniref:Uncharacterized protein n=1 Tax=Parasponia andersonii TaxID=3476 RepID=A0A2P5C7A1_PARAD|nr:hypothetical protein PanWU01x14_177790 [Parasponia andersonii]